MIVHFVGWIDDVDSVTQAQSARDTVDSQTPKKEK